MEITKNETILTAKIIEAAGYDGNFNEYADKNIATNDLQCIAYAAYALGIIAFGNNGNENAASAFKRICDYVYDESDFNDDEVWAFHQFID